MIRFCTKSNKRREDDQEVKEEQGRLELRTNNLTLPGMKEQISGPFVTLLQIQFQKTMLYSVSP